MSTCDLGSLIGSLIGSAEVPTVLGTILAAVYDRSKVPGAVLPYRQMLWAKNNYSARRKFKDFIFPRRNVQIKNSPGKGR
jgi:hypothetical protein